MSCRGRGARVLLIYGEKGEGEEDAEIGGFQ